MGGIACSTGDELRDEASRGSYDLESVERMEGGRLTTFGEGEMGGGGSADDPIT